MNQKAFTQIIIILIIAGILIIGGGVWYWQSQKGKPAAEQPITPTPNNISASNPISTSSIQVAQPSLLQQPKVTVYQGGFVKIEIPLNKKVSYEDNSIIVKSVFAAETGQTYEVYRSTGSSNDFTKIATAVSSEGTNYLAVFDKDYPRDAETLLYRYARLDNNGPVYSGISTADLQKAIDEGHQPWRLDPLWVAEADNNKFRTPCGGFGSDNSGKDFSNGTGKIIGESGSVTYCDVFTLVSVAASVGVAEAEVVHDGKIYIIDLIKPVPGDGKIWMIKEIREKT